mmetsp:Transcript_36533/g.56094  ORF Transcript_36533/g.56094 Transcript_36533/m.56094 type:complete len:100 (+) Transcript_36533:202-501(+)
MVYDHLVNFRKKLYEYILISFLLAVGLLIIYAGKVKSTVFCKQSNKIIIRKRNAFCCRKTVTVYPLDRVTDARAVWRGLKVENFDTQHYSVILDFRRRD